MTLRARDLGQDDFLAYRALTTDAFGGRETETENRPFTPGQSVIGIDSSALPGGADGVLAAAARIRHDEIALGGGVAMCGGVAGLAVHPAHRGQGLFDATVRAVVERCQRDGMAFSMLFPSNASIYRRHGYQNVIEQWEVIVPLQDLQRLRPVDGRRLTPVTAATMPRLKALYRELTAGDHGMLRRTGPLFDTAVGADGMPGDGWSAILLQDEDGTDRGYLSWTRASDRGWEAGLLVHEVLGRSREDLVTLLAALGSWSTVMGNARIRLRTDDPLRDVLPSGHLRQARGDREVVQVRVIDTVRALTARPAPAHLSGGIVLEITDGSASAGLCEAAGRFLVSAADGAVSATRLSLAEADVDAAEEIHGTVRLDIHAASLLLIGGRTLAEARRLFLHAEADVAAEAWFDALVAGPRPAILDAF